MQYSVLGVCLFVAWVASILIANAVDELLKDQHVESATRHFICAAILSALVAITTACGMVGVLRV